MNDAAAPDLQERRILEKKRTLRETLDLCREMTWKQRWEYFKDYYLFQTVCIAAAIAVCLLLGWHFLLREDNVSFYVAVLDETLDETKAEELKNALGEELGLDPETIMIDDRFYLAEDGWNKLEIYIKNGQIDVLIADSDDYEELCGYGLMADMTQISDASFQTAYGDQLFYAAGYLESDEVSFEDNETGRGEVKAYGVQSAETDRCQALRNYQERPVVGIPETAKYPDRSLQCITWLLQEE